MYGVGAVAALAAAVALSKKNKTQVKVQYVDIEQPVEKVPAKETKKAIKATLKHVMMKNEMKANLM